MCLLVPCFLSSTLGVSLFVAAARVLSRGCAWAGSNHVEIWNHPGLMYHEQGRCTHFILELYTNLATFHASTRAKKFCPSVAPCYCVTLIDRTHSLESETNIFLELINFSHITHLPHIVSGSSGTLIFQELSVFYWSCSKKVVLRAKCLVKVNSFFFSCFVLLWNDASITAIGISLLGFHMTSVVLSSHTTDLPVQKAAGHEECSPRGCDLQ